MKTILRLLATIALFWGSQAHAQVNVADTTSCSKLALAGYLWNSEGQWRKSYDTIKLYIDYCAYSKNSYRMFQYAAGDVSGLAGGNTQVWAEFREWLKSVLYNNPDSMYYCTDVFAMLGSLQTEDKEGDQAAQAAVAAYILREKPCSLLANDLKFYYTNAVYERHKMWADTVKVDTMLFPFDTTLPTLEDINLEILRGKPAGVVQPPTASLQPALVGVKVLTNPVDFAQDLELEIELSRQCLVTIGLYDLLGNEVPLQLGKYLLKNEGEHRFSLPASSLPSGSYFIRVTTDKGDVRSLKVVKR